MTDVRILGVETVAFAIPRKITIVEAVWRSVVADGQDAVIITDNTSTDLGARIFAAHCGKSSEADKVLIPIKIILALFTHLTPLAIYYTLRCVFCTYLC